MSRMNKIICPHCGEEFEPSEALQHEVLEKVRAEEKERTKKEVERVKKDTLEKSSIEIKDLQKQNEEQSKKIQEFREEELKLREQKRLLEEKEKDLEIKVEREVDKKSKEVEEKIEEKYKIREKDKDLQIDKLKNMLEEASRKAPSTSQQIQGESLEIELENRLKSAFPNDEIVEVGKGVRGGDIIQSVRNSYGKTAGKILWETKRATWTPGWLPKLREDSRKTGASLSILVSESLPKEITTFKYLERVIVTSFQYAIPLATILRLNLMQIAAAKSSLVNKDQKLEMLFTYLLGDAFRHRFEAYAEGIVEMQKDLETEKRSSQKLWKRRETQINRSLENISNIWGELQGIIGTNSLPDIKILSLESGDVNNQHDNEAGEQIEE